MPAVTLWIDPALPEQAFSRSKIVLASGGVIAYPTDTYYGLGADPGNRRAVQRLFAIKGRRPDQPILLLIADPGDAATWAAEIPPRATELMKRYWPGPLTIVLKARPNVLTELSAGTGTIGLRVPGSDMTRQLLRFLGHGLTGTSANPSGRPSPRTARETAEAVGGAIDLILDGGETAGGKPSTVIDASGQALRLIREGAIPSKDIMV